LRIYTPCQQPPGMAQKLLGSKVIRTHATQDLTTAFVLIDAATVCTPWVDGSCRHVGYCKADAKCGETGGSNFKSISYKIMDNLGSSCSVERRRKMQAARVTFPSSDSELTLESGTDLRRLACTGSERSSAAGESRRPFQWGGVWDRWRAPGGCRINSSMQHLSVPPGKDGWRTLCPEVGAISRDSWRIHEQAREKRIQEAGEGTRQAG
jgi:hypothetical protein